MPQVPDSGEFGALSREEDSMAEIDEGKKERYRQLTEDIATEDKVYIVFEGRPKVFYNHTPQSGPGSLSHAEGEAYRMAEVSEGEATIMCVPKASVEVALLAKYHGVVIHSLDEGDDEE